MSGCMRWGHWPTGWGSAALSAQIPAGLVGHDEGVGPDDADAGRWRRGVLRSSSTAVRGSAVRLDAVPHHPLDRPPHPRPCGKPPPGCEPRSPRLGHHRRRPVVLDLDAGGDPLRAQARHRRHLQGRVRLRPHVRFADATGEALAAILRPGNATANSSPTSSPPWTVAVAEANGHAQADRPVVPLDAERKLFRHQGPRGDLAGHRGAGRWAPALTQGGEVRPGAKVAELTDLINLDHWQPPSCAESRSIPVASSPTWSSATDRRATRSSGGRMPAPTATWGWT